ncbi:WG repeat-containing protein [Paenibacillus hunanensis]|uniref:WG repeat-containing protein n=1 Tax=Paenibacillus hunanensis TaxID=539262 RepID=UPI002A69E2D2|nr:WG repeat-containing protein [Paenibacillus hunanensis]WPP41765.1 WG repeat-containing protein [Paenibacillus hunanensis]
MNLKKASIPAAVLITIALTLGSSSTSIYASSTSKIVQVSSIERKATISLNVNNATIPYTTVPTQSDGSFHDGRILTAASSGDMNFYDQKGKVAFTLAKNLFPVADFHDQRALVKDTATHLYGYINTKGKLVVPCHYVEASSFSDGVAVVKKNKDEHGSLINTSGKQVTTLERTYDSDFQFSDGLAVAYSADNGKAGYLNTGGRIVIPYTYDYARTFSEGAAVVQDPTGKYGFINRQGKVMIPLQYQAAGDFSEGLAAVQNSKGVWGYMDTKGKIAIPFQYASAASFSEGLAAVYNKQGKVGYINKQGKVVIDYSQYNKVSSFNEGVAVVGIETKTSRSFGYIDTRGTLLTALKYKKAYPFHEGVAIASISDQAAVILSK